MGGDDEDDGVGERPRDRRITTPEVLVIEAGTPEPRVPPGGDSWVGATAGAPGRTPERPEGRLLSLAWQLISAGLRLLVEALELHKGNLPWNATTKAAMNGKLRRMGHDLDQALGRPLP